MGAPVTLEGKWKDACRIVFGEELGGLDEYAPWLSGLTEPVSRHRSAISRKEVISAPTEYCKEAPWLAFDEVDFGRKFGPLGINEIKDVDSIAEALTARAYYAGSIVFGKSAQIEKSSNINDSIGIYNVGRLGDSKYVAYSTMCRYAESCFGCNFLGESSFCIRANDCFRNRRSFELWRCQQSSDIYYSHGLMNCSDCFFSFNVRNKRYLIGNLELGREKYASLKEKLLSEMAGELRGKKRLPSLPDIVEAGRYAKPVVPAASERIDANDVQDKQRIEEAFSKASSVIFGKPLEGGIDSYSGWLKRHTRPVIPASSAASGRRVYVPNCAGYPGLPKDRLLALNEAEVYGQSVKMSPDEVEGLSLANVHERIGTIAFFDVEFIEGKNTNIIDCAICFDSANCYRSTATVYAKYCGYCFWPRDSQYLFGADSPFDSSFCINIYSCTSQTRCFEIDCCGYCTDTYFSHNCENVNDSMFCFNTKNRRHCIGNAPLPPTEYNRIKSSLLSQIHGELSSGRDFRYDIYNILCPR